MKTDLTKLLEEFKSIPKYKRTKTFIEIAGYAHYENVCSNILSFYLNPKDEHELKDLVLNSLMLLVDEEFYCDEIKIDREYPTKNDKRIDIVMQTENHVIGIENKIFSGLYNDLSEYKDTVKSLCNGERKPVCIVLSLNKLTSPTDLEKMEQNDFENITYEQIFSNIKENIGEYISNANIGYVNHLMDFIKSIKNLNQRTMEDKEFLEFFRKNYDTIIELMYYFEECDKQMHQKVYQLLEAMPKSEFVKPNIYKERALCFNYIINSYNVCVDAYSIIKGWDISIWGKNRQSIDFLLNVMCGKDSDFKPEFLEEDCRTSNRVKYKPLDTDTDISVVVKALSDLLKRIEDFKKRIEST